MAQLHGGVEETGESFENGHVSGGRGGRGVIGAWVGWWLIELLFFVVRFCLVLVQCAVERVDA